MRGRSSSPARSIVARWQTAGDADGWVAASLHSFDEGDDYELECPIYSLGVLVDIAGKRAETVAQIAEIVRGPEGLAELGTGTAPPVPVLCNAASDAETSPAQK
jgi:hypothetical protein